MLDDERQTLYIDPPSGHIGSDEKLDTFFLKTAHHFVAILLTEVALDDGNRQSGFFQLLAHTDGTGTRAAEDEAARRTLQLKITGNECVFLLPCADRILMIDIAVHDLLRLDLHALSVWRHVIFNQAMQFLLKSGRKKPC